MAKEERFYFENFDGVTELYRRDRTVANRMAVGKGQSVGTFVTILVNELERLGRDDSLTISVTKED